MLHRLDDWPGRLHAFMRARRSIPYAYGTNDCFWFSHAAVLATTGTDILPDIEPPTSRFAAARFLMGAGYGDIEGLMTALVGAPLASPKLAGRGDIVSFETFGDPANERHLAVVDGTGAVTPGRDRMIWVPRVLWRTGWKI